MKFTINSTPTQATRKCEGLLKLEAACCALKAGELITLKKLAATTQMSVFGAVRHAPSMDQSLRIRQGTIFYYGNPKTIAAYRKEIQG